MSARQTRLLAAGFCLALLAPALAAETVVIVSARNADIRVTPEQVKHIFLGKSRQFPNGNRAVPIDQPEGALRAAFYQAIAELDPLQLRTYWSRQTFTGKGRPPLEAHSAAEVITQVADNPALIGYVDRQSLHGDQVVVVLTLGSSPSLQVDPSISVFK